MIKRWYYSASHWRLGDVMMANITAVFFTLIVKYSLRVAQSSWKCGADNVAVSLLLEPLCDPKICYKCICGRPGPRWGSSPRSPRPTIRLGRGKPPPHSLPPSAPAAPRPRAFVARFYSASRVSLQSTTPHCFLTNRTLHRSANVTWSIRR